MQMLRRWLKYNHTVLIQTPQGHELKFTRHWKSDSSTLITYCPGLIYLIPRLYFPQPLVLTLESSDLHDDWLYDQVMRSTEFQTVLFFRNLNNHVHHKHTTNVVCKNKKCKLISQQNNTKQYFNRIVIKTDDTLDDITSNINNDIHSQNGINININSNWAHIYAGYYSVVAQMQYNRTKSHQTVFPHLCHCCLFVIVGSHHVNYLKYAHYYHWYSLLICILLH